MSNDNRTAAQIFADFDADFQIIIEPGDGKTLDQQVINDIAVMIELRFDAFGMKTMFDLKKTIKAATNHGL